MSIKPEQIDPKAELAREVCIFIEKLRLDPDDVILLRIGSQVRPELEFDVRDALMRAPIKGRHAVIVLRDGVDLAAADEEEMRAAGWVRAR